MFRYFACVWNAQNLLQCRQASALRPQIESLSSQWRCALDAPGLFVLCANETPRSLRCHRLPNDAGCVLGSLFVRSHDLNDDEPSARPSIDERFVENVTSSQGRYLIEHCWGNYVAFLREHHDVRVIVSPAGWLPCLTSTVDQNFWFYSCLSDALALGLRPVPSHTYIRARVLGLLPDSGNPLTDVGRLLRGETMHFSLAAHPPGIQRHCLWDPYRFTQQDQRLEDPQFAATALRNVVRSCTHTLARDYDHVQLRLSGGLDSSIIAGCLREQPTRVACHTYLTRDTRADPRPWARLAAEHAGFELTELIIEPNELSLSGLARLRPSADIVPRLTYLFQTPMEHTLCKDQGSTAIFTGDGGDAGLCSDCAVVALTQHLKHHGVTPYMWPLSHHIALSTHRSRWHVLRRSLRQWRHREPWLDLTSVDPDDAQLAATPHRDWLQAHKRPWRHPWAPADLHESSLTCFRLGALISPIEEHHLSLDIEATSPEVIMPLCTQPAVEVMLRIPVYHHFERGIDRGLARRAFARDASPPNLTRVWKDRAPGFLNKLFLQERDWMRETLLNGALADGHYIDLDKTADALSGDPSPSSVNPAELLRLLDIELWATKVQG